MEFVAIFLGLILGVALIAVVLVYLVGKIND